jgi:(3S)-linalool synthase
MVYRWSKELGLTKELEFARDEPIKWYMWPMACLPDPRFSEERIETTKPLSLIYIIDDLFDFHGNIDELTLFTDAVKRYSCEQKIHLNSSSILNSYKQKFTF